MASVCGEDSRGSPAEQAARDSRALAGSGRRGRGLLRAVTRQTPGEDLEVRRAMTDNGAYAIYALVSLWPDIALFLVHLLYCYPIQ